MAIIFYKERTVFVDIAFHLFSLITTETWAIQNFRFGAILTQALPLLGIKLGLSLKTLAILYSISFPLLYLGVFLMITRYLHQHRLGLLLLGYNLIMVTDTFYWIQSELSQGIALLILYFASLFWVDQHSQKQTHIIWTIIHPLFLFMLAFFHPLILIPFSFLWMYFWHIGALSSRLLHLSGASFMGMYFIKFIFFKTPYDQGSIAALKNWKDYFPRFDEIPSMQVFALDLFQDYYLLVIGALAILVWCLYHRKWKTLLLTIGGFIGYATLVNVAYPTDTVKFYRENLQLPLALFILAPVIFEISSTIRPKKIVYFFMIISIIRIAHIQHTHSLYTQRLEWMRTYMTDAGFTGQSKLIVDNATVPKEILFMTWATSYEFWLLSTLETGNTASIIMTDRPQDAEWAAGKGDVFISQWGVFSYAELPERYFHFQDGSPYRIIRPE